jgi:Flp pilus assembly protein TadD
MRVAAIVCLGAAALAGCLGEPVTGMASLDTGAPPNPAGAPLGECMARVASDVEAHGEAETALMLYQRAAATIPNAANYVTLGDAYLRAGWIDESATAYRAALTKDANNDAALLGLGTALARSRRLSEGVDLLSKAAPRLHTAAAYARLGVAQTLAGRLDDAKVSLAEAQDLAPDDPGVVTNLALATALAGDHDRALELARRGVELPGAETGHWRNLVIVAGLAGRPDEARAAASQKLAARVVESLLRRAASIRGIADPERRALAVGNMSPASRGSRQGEERGAVVATDRPERIAARRAARNRR